ncbi:MAG TPA: hypothetical protein VMU30_08505 [Bacteroidota bacterium]|nr:hypothetical protein [Bacteroidota bacterium]
MKNFIVRIKTIWLSFARLLGKVNTMILLSLVYLTFIGMMALIVRLFRKDLLQKKMNPAQRSYWHNNNAGDQTLDRCKYQF